MNTSSSLRKKSYKCQACPNDDSRKKFDNVEEYTSHLETEHGWCKHCRAFFQTKEQASDHAYSTDYHCTACLKCFENESKAEAHRKKKHSELQAKSSPINRRNVYDDDQGSPLPFCHRCKKVFHKRSRYLDHDCPAKDKIIPPRTLQPNTKGRTECYICEISFGTVDEAKVHVQNKHHPCHLCRRFFAKKESLAAHLASSRHVTQQEITVDSQDHPQSNPHPCIIQSSQQHVASRMEEGRGIGSEPSVPVRNIKSYCLEHDHIYKSADTLVDHMTKHHTGAQFKCLTCDTTFTMPKDFRTHLAENKEHMKILLQVLVPSVTDGQKLETSSRHAAVPLVPNDRHSGAPNSVPTALPSTRPSLPAGERHSSSNRGPPPTQRPAPQRTPRTATSTPKRRPDKSASEHSSVRSLPASSTRTGPTSTPRAALAGQPSPIKIAPPQAYQGAHPQPHSTPQTHHNTSFQSERRQAGAHQNESSWNRPNVDHRRPTGDSARRNDRPLHSNADEPRLYRTPSGTLDRAPSSRKRPHSYEPNDNYSQKRGRRWERC